MCGIIGTIVKNKETVKAEILLIFESQKHRGHDGFGIVIRKTDGTFLRERVTTLDAIINMPIWDNLECNDVVIFHHRQPTSTPNISICNHPFINEEQSITLAHNGIIHDATELLKESLASHKYESVIIPGREKDVEKKYHYCITDSEIALHKLEDFLAKGSFNKALSLFQTQFSGTFFIIFKQKPLIFFTTKNSDLAIYNSVSGNVFITSEFGDEVDADGIGFLDGTKVTFTWRSKYNNYRGYTFSYKNNFGGYYNEPIEYYDSDMLFNVITFWEDYKEGRSCTDKECLTCDLFPDCVDQFCTNLSCFYNSDDAGDDITIKGAKEDDIEKLVHGKKEDKESKEEITYGW